MLKDLNFDMCRGCYSCVVRGEDKCQIKDDRDMILKEMTEADGVIFSSPTYSHMVSSLMKNFFDRFIYLAHRPQFFDKYSMSVTTYSGYGAEFAIQYMDKMAKVFVFEVMPPFDITAQPGKQSEEAKQHNKNKTIEAFKVFISKIKKGERSKPTLNYLVPFHIFKLGSELEGDYLTADRKYYEDKTNYYFEIKLVRLRHG